MLNLNTLAIVLFILPVYQLMYHTIQLVTFRKEERDPSRFPFGFLMLFMLVFLINSALHYLGYYNIYQYLYVIQLPALLAVLPTFHLYVYALLKAENSFYAKYPIVYYLPAFFVLLMNLISFIGMNRAQIMMFFADRLSFTSSQDIMVNTAVLVFLLGAAVFVLMQLFSSAYQFNKIIKQMKLTDWQEGSRLDYINTKGLVIIFFSVYIFVLLNALMIMLDPAYYAIEAMLYNLAMIICGGLAGYFRLKQNRKLHAVHHVIADEPGHSYAYKNGEKPSNTDNAEILDTRSAKEMMQRLRSFVNSEKPYRKSDLNIGELASELQTSKRRLSWLLNNKMDTNFYGLMNKYRVLEAKELLKRFECKHLKMDEIGRMAGFKSKSSFNNAFREQTGKTPSEYRKSL
ncbi:MAG: helix-turn-helix domain-containing protein [Bacteroidales bacterium]|nr:helix-turn-helix domain-containing protein [Bacteroidales bacterium]MCF8345065.1 helix-turn-helix domain-containing protein [Bacteroidales bacterium]MCF8377633.1 helix-turn-helix domain-containing protein [Bacteroidales bacterium]MCF8402023.1 helix-turn-helix domain-containing protein [Bacteroidales bacterium]